jgi:uncharacterized protein
MTEFIIVPGFGGSDSSHWQSQWEKNDLSMKRFQPSSWDNPELSDWIDALELAVSQTSTPPVLIAHSLGCLLVASWRHVSARPVLGAFLVAVPDPATPGFAEMTPSFCDVPTAPLRFPSLIISSTDDPFDTQNYARTKAEQWGSDHHSIGNAGHINGQSGLGAWAVGRELLEAFVAKTEQ